jgi:integrase/recombinase XerD
MDLNPPKDTQPGPKSPESNTQVFSNEKLALLSVRFLNNLRRTGKSAHTLAAYRNDISLFALFLLEKGHSPQNFGLNLKEEWEHYLREHGRVSAASVRRALMSVRSFLHFLVAEKLILSSPLLEVKSPEQPKLALMRISEDQYHRLKKELVNLASSGDEKSTRDLALVLLLGDCGLKASEVSLLRWNQVFLTPSLASGSLVLNGEIERLVPFGDECAQALSELKTLRNNIGLVAKGNDPVLFGYANANRHARTDHLHRHGIKFVIYEITESHLGTPFNSESLRNRAILKWLDQGLHVEQVAHLAGYSSLNSLNRFANANKVQRSPRRKHKRLVGES